MLSKKYARAYLNVFGDNLSLDQIESFKKAHNFFQEHKRALFLLQVPLIDIAVNEKVFWRL